jgi:hypothetical protein
MRRWRPGRRVTVADLNRPLFDESSRQIGVDEANDFISGELQNGLRRQLFDNLATVPDVFSLDTLPPSPLLKPGSDPAKLLGLTSTGGLSQNDLLNLLKLEAPLAVQARPPHAGFFPLNKFSVVPLLMKAARTAARTRTAMMQPRNSWCCQTRTSWRCALSRLPAVHGASPASIQAAAR